MLGQNSQQRQANKANFKKERDELSSGYSMYYRLTTRISKLLVSDLSR